MKPRRDSFRDKLFKFYIALRHEREQVLLGLGGLLLVYVLGVLSGSVKGGDWFDLIWWQSLDPFLTLATLTAALGVWFFEAYHDWEESLDKRLYAIFQIQGRPVFRCDHAPLFGESDIRNFAQQIGAQMSGGLLNFSLDIHRYPPTIERAGKDRYKRWVVVFELDAQTPIQWSDKAREDKQPEICAMIETGEFLYWPQARRLSNRESRRAINQWSELPRLPWTPTPSGPAELPPPVVGA